MVICLELHNFRGTRIPLMGHFTECKIAESFLIASLRSVVFLRSALVRPVLREE